MRNPVCTKREIMFLLQVDEKALNQLERRTGVRRRGQWYTLWEMTRIKSAWKESQTEKEQRVSREDK